MKIIEKQLNAIGDIPDGTKYIILNKQSTNFYSAIFLDELNDINLCGIRGNIVIYIGDLNQNIKEELIYPLLVAGSINNIQIFE